jgi:aconitate hydratase
VLSGNRNFEGRVHPKVKANYLASPPLVVAYALAGRVDIDFAKEPIGHGTGAKPVYLKDIWPTQKEVANIVEKCVTSEMYKKSYADVYQGDTNWRSLDVPLGTTFAWDPKSTYIKPPPYFEAMPLEPTPVADISGARVLGVFGDSITTDHISPAGNIDKNGAAGTYLQQLGVASQDFNSYGARRGNHEVMMRGTFANVRLKNGLVPGVEGSFTLHFPSEKQMSIFEAAEAYKKAHVPLMILAGKEYGSGSSRDWAAKGPMLLGIRLVIAESFERIHRTNLVGMGILPLQFTGSDTIKSLGLTGHEVYSTEGLPEGVNASFRNSKLLTIVARKKDKSEIRFQAQVRIDTPKEVEYFKHGGILSYVLRQLIRRPK